MFSPVEEIKSRLDLVEFIQSYIRLQKTGINYKAICPFHTEKTPSFFVSPARQIWHCFGGCGKGGDIFKFVMEIEGLDFPEALRMLAQRAGVVLKKEDPAIRSERNRLYDICEEATKTFQKNLSLTPAVKSYLKKRGVTDETILKFRIGFAPQSWDFLLRSLLTKGFKKEEVEKAGLAVKSEDNSSTYDRFRSRIIFPIADANGAVIGFGGRVFAEVPARSAVGTPTSGLKEQNVGAKYVNTPNTLIYDKSRVLYGFDLAKNEIRTKNQVVVVEGYMDCIMSHQAGVKNTIAVSGTALTPHQLKNLKRLCHTILSSFDIDAAGESATKRSLALAAEFEFERKIVAIPTGKDPADTILENADTWRKAVDTAQPVVEFYFAKVFRENDPKQTEGKKKISAVLVPLLAEINDEIQKAHWVQELAKGLGVSEETVWKEVRRYENRNNVAGHAAYVNSRPEEKKQEPRTRRNLLEERLLALMTTIEEKVRIREIQNHHIVFTSSLNQELFNALTGGMVIVTPSLEAELNLLKFKSEVLGRSASDLEEDFTACKRELEKECIKERLLALGSVIDQKEKEGQQIAVASLLRDFRTLSEKLKNI